MDGVGVVIVSYRTPAETTRAAQSADRQVAEVVVVDNSPDAGGRAPVIKLSQARSSVISSGANLGFGRAANIGAKAVAVDALLFLNSDAALHEGAVRALLAELEHHNGAAIVAPRLVWPDGSVQRAAGLRPTPPNLGIRVLGLHAIAKWLASRPGLRQLLMHTQMAREYDSAAVATSTIDTSMVSGACFAIGREAFWELGGFDERFFMYFEDADLCRRAEDAGIPIRYVPSAIVTHIGGASSEGDYHYSPLYARSMRQYLEKWWGPPGAALAILLLWLRLVGHALVLHKGTGQAFAALRAAVPPEKSTGR